MPLLTAKSIKWLFLPERVSEDYIAEFFDFRTLSSNMQATVIHTSLYLLKPEHPLRVRAVQIIHSPIFTGFILFAILVNSMLLALDDPKSSTVPWSDKSAVHQMLYIMDIIFGIIFIGEAVVKVIALGFILHRHSYLRDLWNILDFFIVCTFPLAVAGTGGLTALRVFRVFRPLRSISRVESLRAILNKLIRSLPRLTDVFALMMFVTWFSAVLGINLFAGIHDQRCFYDDRDYNSTWSKTAQADTPQWRLVKNLSNFICDDTEDSCRNFARLATLPVTNATPRVACRSDPTVDTFSLLSFTNIGTALVLSLKLIARDNWSSQISAISSGLGIGSFFYFFIVTFFGGYFCLNLFIAVLTSAFQTSDDLESARKEFPYRMRFAHALGGTVLADTALCLCHESQRTDVGELRQHVKAAIRAKRRMNTGAEEARTGGGRGAPAAVAAASAMLDDAAPGGGRGGGGGVVDAIGGAVKGFFETLESGMSSTYEATGGKRGGSRRRHSLSASARRRMSSGSSSSETSQDDDDDLRDLDEVAASRLRMQRRRSNLAASMIGPRPNNLDDSQSLVAGAAAAASASGNDELRHHRASPPPTTLIAESKNAIISSDDVSSNSTLSSSQRKRSWCSWANMKKFFKRKGWMPLHDLVITVQYTIFVMVVTLIFAVALSFDAVDVDPVTASNVNLISFGCNIFFLVDVVMKLVGLGPSFFTSPMNLLDLGLAAASIPDLVNATSNALSALRAIRLLRLLRIAKQWRSLQRLMSLILIALKSVASLSLVALIFIYIFAILGYQVFNQDVGKTRFSFSTVFDSLLTVFVLVTGENWSDMARDLFPEYGVGCVFFFVPIFIIGNFFIANLFIAIIIESFSEVAADEEDEDEMDLTAAGGGGGGGHRERSNSHTADHDDGGEDAENRSSSNNSDVEMHEGEAVTLDSRGAYNSHTLEILDAIEDRRQLLVPCEDSSDEEKDLGALLEHSNLSNGNGRNTFSVDGVLPNHDAFRPRPQSDFHRQPLGLSGVVNSGSNNNNNNNNNNKNNSGVEHNSDLTPAAAAASTAAMYNQFKRQEQLGASTTGPTVTFPDGAADDQKENQLRAAGGARSRDEATTMALAQRLGVEASFDDERRDRASGAAATLLKKFVRQRGVTPESLSLVGDCRMLTRAAAREMQHVERIRHEEQRLAQHAVAFVTLSRVKKQTNQLAAAADKNLFGRLRDDTKKEVFRTVAEQRALEERFIGCRYRSLFYFEPTHKRRARLVEMIKGNFFNALIVALILISTILLVLDTPLVTSSAPGFDVAIVVTDYIIAIAFALEVMIKLIALGGFMHEGSYFRSFFNILDFSATIFSIVALGVPSIKPLRILRFARIMSLTFHMRIVITSLLQALPGMTSVLVFMIFVWWVFAIVGVASFKGLYGACNNISLSQAECNGTTTTTQTLMDGTVIAQTIPLQWFHQMPSSNFDDVKNAFFSLFKLSLGDGWFAMMYIALDSPGVGMAPVRNSNPFAAAYFVVFMIIGNFFILNLFVGVLADRFVALRQRGSGYHLLSEAQKMWVLAQRVLFRTEVPITPPVPTNALRRWCFYEVQTARFDIFFTIVIVLQSVQLSMYAAPGTVSEMYNRLLDAFGIVMLCLFTIEIIMKILAVNPILFWRLAWNRLDFIIVSLSWLGVFIGNQISLIRVFRVGRLFLLLRKLQGIQTLFVALYQAIPELINVGVVLTVVYMIFAVIGVALFSNIPNTVAPLSSLVNFHNVGAALIALYVCMTTDGWDAIADAVAVEESSSGLCSNAAGTCGTPWIAYLYFILFMFIMSMILVNLLITVVLGNFKDAEIAEEQETLFQVIQEFRDRWAENDSDGTQKLDVAVVLRLLPTLPPAIWDHTPLKVRGRSLPMWIHFLRQLQRFHVPIGQDHTCAYQDVIASLALRLFCVNVEDAIRSSRTTNEGVTWDDELFSIHHHFAAMKLSKVARRFIRARGERMAVRQLREIKEQHAIIIENEYVPLRRSHDEAVALARFTLQRAVAAETQAAKLRRQLQNLDPVKRKEADEKEPTRHEQSGKGVETQNTS